MTFQIGLTSGTLVDVTTLSADAEAPFGQFKTWSRIVDLGNGMQLGLGRPQAYWTWLIIPPLLKNILRSTYIISPAKSARLYIRTVNNLTNNTFATYSAVAIWPEHENLYTSGGFQIAYSASSTASFVLEFRDLVLSP